MRSYKMRNKDGLGAVFIIDRFVYAFTPAKVDTKGTIPARTSYYGAVYVVFFDIATRE
ncbi:MAG TPA: hypothetical protein VFZ59_03560 [Verrucomicrobiae bacterium]|nr:hypothetical protein [Verrucomicrobiae bacterium]